MKALLALLFATAVLLASDARAASCCGVASAAPTLITGDDLGQVSVSVAQSQIVGDAPATGLPVFRANGDDEQAQTLRIEGAFLVADRWQLGASIPVTRRSRETARMNSSASGIGDIGLSAAYEILPEWDYSPWKPRGFVFTQLTIPTGGSAYDASLTSSQPWGMDARGRGFYSGGAGALFVKSWSSWDALLIAETHRSFTKTFTDPGTNEPLKLTPGWGGSLGLGAGYSPGRLPIRFGLLVSPAHEGGTLAEGSIDSHSSSQLVWNTSLLAAWMPTRQSSVSAIYTDQTLVGPASNVALNRTFAVLLQKRWER
jgi:hypothetical protein